MFVLVLAVDQWFNLMVPFRLMQICSFFHFNTSCPFVIMDTSFLLLCSVCCHLIVAFIVCSMSVVLRHCSSSSFMFHVDDLFCFFCLICSPHPFLSEIQSWERRVGKNNRQNILTEYFTSCILQLRYSARRKKLKARLYIFLKLTNLYLSLKSMF